jgi:TetR/AcrR family transcriptional regulator, cholesterol catabolism regulator
MKATGQQDVPPRNGAPTRSGVYLPTVGRRDQVERRDRIIRAAIDLLTEREFDKIQIRDVAERAGIALATAYRYYSSKDHLYASALVYWSSDFISRVREQGAAGDTDEERLLGMVQRILRVIERWPQFVRAAILLETSPDELAQEQMRVFTQQYAQTMGLCIRDLDPQSAADVLMVIRAVYDMGVTSWALDRMTFSQVEQSLRRAIRLLFHGVPGAM